MKCPYCKVELIVVKKYYKKVKVYEVEECLKCGEQFCSPEQMDKKIEFIRKFAKLEDI